MAHTVTHAFVSGIADVAADTAAGKVTPTRWNESHTVTLDFGEAGDISAEAFGDTAAAGSTGEVADAGHRHAMPADPVTAHAAAADPHTGYRLESADHTHASTGAQGGVLTGYAALLADPGNVWEAETVVVEGYRIAFDAALIFQVVTPGTTDSVEPTWVPSTSEITDGTAGWLFIGIIGNVPQSAFLDALSITAMAGQTVPLTSPTVQNVIDALVAAFGLVQSD